MHQPEPGHLSFILENLAGIITGSVILLLALLGFLGKKAEAKAARDKLLDSQPTHADLLRCKLEVNQVIQEEFAKLRYEAREDRKEFTHEIEELHKRITAEIRRANTDG